MATDTGNGGFEIDGKSYTFDHVEPGESGGEPLQSSKGDIQTDDSKKDIGENVKRTIGQYLNRRTVEEKNSYTVDAQSVESSITTEQGYPRSPTPSPNSSKFSSNRNITGTTFIPQDLKGDRNKKIDDPSTKIAFKKGRSPEQIPDGHSVLPSVEKNKLPDSIAPYISSVLSNNRFSDAAKATEGLDDVANPSSNYNPTLRHPEFGEVSMHRLAQVGPALSIRASAELNASTRGNNPTNGASEAKALLPSANQVGATRVDLVQLEAKDVLRTLTEDEIDESTLTDITPGGSWGSLNNVHDHYSGINALGMIGLSIALTGATLLLYEGLSFIINLINGGSAAPSVDSDGAYVLGRSSALPQSNPNSFPPAFPPDLSALIGIRPTVNPFPDALDAGTNAFFGVSDEGGLLGTVVSGIESATENPQFNSIVARSIIRSGLSLIDAFKDIGGNPISVIQGVLGVIDVLRSSKIIGAMNVFAQLGDAVLLDNESDISIQKPGQPIKKSTIDKLGDDVFASAVKKNRLSSGLKLAWSNNRSPAAYLLPDSVSALSVLVPQFGGPTNIVGLAEDKARIIYKRLGSDDIQSKGARIPYDGDEEITVKKVEGLLEGDYMPFYFHDLRTNEIISFHAFLTSMTDDYTANWESSEGFGRVDPVKIYKNTNRSISIGWYVVSTSEEDFDDMWFKINKLVTMVYPQYTEGRLAATENSTFVQPFSQLQGASPLIRLRLGDVLRSNYSRFALARLFGADGNKMKINDQELSFKDSQAVISDIQQLIKDAKENPNSGNHSWALQHASLPIINQSGITIRLPTPPGFASGGSPGRPPQVSPVFKPDASDLRFFKFKVTGKDGNSVFVEPSIMNESELTEQFSINPSAAREVIEVMNSRYNNSENSANRMVGAQYVTHKENLIPSYSMLREFRNRVAASGGVSEEALSELNEFMNPESNALVRSFQSTRGKGLAGTIESINFDFYDNIKWETLPGKRAPQFLKVTINFTPIHDISPGIDHQGFNRAPIYPVGHLAHTNDVIKEGNR